MSLKGRFRGSLDAYMILDIASVQVSRMECKCNKRLTGRQTLQHCVKLGSPCNQDSWKVWEEIRGDCNILVSAYSNLSMYKQFIVNLSC